MNAIQMQSIMKPTRTLKQMPLAKIYGWNIGIKRRDGKHDHRSTKKSAKEV